MRRFRSMVLAFVFAWSFALTIPTGNGSVSATSGGTEGELHLHLGAQEADVASGGTTTVCVHVTEDDGGPVGQALVEFITSEGRAEPPSASTGDYGGACVKLLAPARPGVVTIVARAECGGRASPEVTTSITVVENREESKQKATSGPDAAAFLLGGLGTVLVVLGVEQLRRKRANAAARRRRKRRPTRTRIRR